MSGIAGIVSSERRDSTALCEGVEKMLKALRHRGRAARRILLEQKEGGPRQLVDFQPAHDLSASKLALGQVYRSTQQTYQIYSDPSQNYWIVLDGAIYNAAAIKTELQPQRTVGPCEQDAEMLLQAYLQWGPDCLRRLNGRWAFVIWDRQQQQLFGSRDRTGVKPFYYYQRNHQWAFASEQKALLKLPFVDAQLDPSAAFDLLVLNTVPSAPDFFANIKVLPPAHYFTLDLNTLQLDIQPYFQSTINRDIPPYKEADFQNHVHEVKALVERAVALRLRNPQRTGALLSGGLDSSVLIDCYRRLQPSAPIQAFTTWFDEPGLDESPWAKQMAEAVRADWQRTSPSFEQFRDSLETLAYCQDSPLTSTGTFAQFSAMQLAAEQGMAYVLDGQGADALFAGHLPHQSAAWLGLISRFRLRQLLKEFQQFGGLGKGLRYLARNLAKYSVLPAMPMAIKRFFDQRYFGELSLFQPDFIEQQSHRYDQYRDNGMADLNSMLGQAYFGAGMQYLLKCVDRSSMWHGVEALTPYADDLDLMTRLFEIPGPYKVREGVSKRLLREAFRASLPPAIVDRSDKMALASPNNRWLGLLLDDLRQLISAQDEQVFRKAELLRRLDQLLKLDRPQENYRLFKYAGFVLWRKVFGV
ncbi:MAG: asparagine synthase (glutamine-hydrolyzing) [Bacteroidota bacterium]